MRAVNLRNLRDNVIVEILIIEVGYYGPSFCFDNGVLFHLDRNVVHKENRQRIPLEAPLNPGLGSAAPVASTKLDYLPCHVIRR
jgi:hypothetical protein